MKKHFFLGLLSGAFLMFGGLFAFAQHWAQTTWPSQEYFLAFDDETGPGRTSCEVYTALGVATRLIFTVPDETGHLPGCLLKVQGSFREDGAFLIAKRPDNFLSVAGWNSQQTQQIVRASMLKGHCTVEDYIAARSGAKTPEGECKRFVEERNRLSKFEK